MEHTLLRLRAFAHEHDDLPAFRAGYLVISFLVASLLSLGAFALLIAIHMCLDIVKYREVYRFTWSETARGVFLESIVDTVLLFTGFAFAVYFHHSLYAVAGMSGILRAEATVVEMLGTTIPKMKILQHSLYILANLQGYLHRLHPGVSGKFGKREAIYLVLLCVAAALIALSPVVLSIDWATFTRIIVHELTPWRV